LSKSDDDVDFRDDVRSQAQSSRGQAEIKWQDQWTCPPPPVVEFERVSKVSGKNLLSEWCIANKLTLTFARDRVTISDPASSSIVCSVPGAETKNSELLTSRQLLGVLQASFLLREEHDCGSVSVRLPEDFLFKDGLLNLSLAKCSASLNLVASCFKTARDSLEPHASAAGPRLFDTSSV
jgi:hypothetical protein